MMSNNFIERANKEILKVNMVTLINCNKLYFLIYTTNYFVVYYFIFENYHFLCK